MIDRKRGQHVQRETWAEGKLMEGETWGERKQRKEEQKGCRKVQYGERVDRQSEEEKDKGATADIRASKDARI